MSLKLSGNFWGEEGPSVISDFIKSGIKNLEALQIFLLERLLIESEISKLLGKLNKKVEALSEYGSLQNVVLTLKEEIEKESNFHNQISVDMKTHLNSLGAQVKDLKKQCKNPLLDADKVNKEYHLLSTKIGASKSKYDQICQSNALKDSKIRSEIDQNKLSKLEKEKQKGAKNQVRAEQDYKQSIQKLVAYQPQYEEKLKISLDLLQDLEKQRRVAFLNSLDQYNKLIKPLESFYGESNNTISGLINSTDLDRDLDRWIEINKKMTSPPQPPPFESYGPSNSHRDSKLVADSSALNSSSGSVVAKDNASKIPKSDNQSANGSSKTAVNTDEETAYADQDADAASYEYTYEPGEGAGEVYAAAWDYEAKEGNEISFKAGENITIVCKDDQGWWTGTNSAGETGLFPANFLEGQ